MIYTNDYRNVERGVFLNVIVSYDMESNSAVDKNLVRNDICLIYGMNMEFL